MPSDTEGDPPVTYAIAEGWAKFAETVLPGIGGGPNAGAHVAFHFGALYVLQLVSKVVGERSAEAAAVALGMLNAELEEFMEAHAVVVQ
jgi:hypothetical protein